MCPVHFSLKNEEQVIMVMTTDLTTPFLDKAKTERGMLLLFIFLLLGEDVATHRLLQTKTSLLSQWVIIKKINIHTHYGFNGIHGILRTRGVIWTTILMEGGIRLELWRNEVFSTLDINLALKYSSGSYNLNKLGKRSICKICYPLVMPSIIFG